MTIDEKIKQAAEGQSMRLTSSLIDADTRARIFTNGANLVKSEMLADMQKLAETVKDIINDLNNNCECSYDEQCTACFLKEKYENALDEFNAKYKEQK